MGLPHTKTERSFKAAMDRQKMYTYRTAGETGRLVTNIFANELDALATKAGMALELVVVPGEPSGPLSRVSAVERT